MRLALQRAVDEHLQRHLGVADPAHTVRKPRRAEAVLAKQVAVAALAEHVLRGHTQILDADLAVVADAGHRVDVADDLPTFGRDIDEERRVARLRRVRVGVGAGDEDREARTLRAGDEPLVAVDHPVVTVLHRCRQDARGIRASNLRLRHREARSRSAFGERTQVSLFLIVVRVVQQRVHVAFVGRLRVQHERPHAGAPRLGRDERHGDMTETHAAPLFRHVRVPQPKLARAVAQAADRGDVAVAVGLVLA